MDNLRLSIITPSFNSKEFIKETIDSVVDQKYPNLEYLIFDGGSKDGTVNILSQQPCSVRWTVEPDAGQSDAINKGLRQATGEIVSWINSNDVYLAGSFNVVDQYFREHPNVDIVFGRANLIDEQSNVLGEYAENGSREENLLLNLDPKGHFKKLLNENSGWLPQQTVFWRKSVMDKAGFLDRDLHYAMDYEYWLRLGSKGRIEFIDEYLGAFRLHENAKSTHAKKHWREILIVHQRYGGKLFCHLHRSLLKLAWRGIRRRLHAD
jgi:glycosyltransferase involved in cell wall biosynthesis